jgi:hypothetical protein
VGVPTAIAIEQLGSQSSQWLGGLLMLLLLGLIMLGGKKGAHWLRIAHGVKTLG